MLFFATQLLIHIQKDEIILVDQEGESKKQETGETVDQEVESMYIHRFRS